MTRKLRYLGPTLLALAGACLALSWERIPEQFVMHWGRHGPDGYAHKGPVVFLPLLIALVPWALLELIASVVERMGPIPELARANAVLLRLIASGVAALVATLAVALPLWQPERPQSLTGVLLLFVIVPAGMGLLHYAREMARLKRSGRAGLEGYSGVIYSNPKDDRLWVPKLNGLGYTLNFAKPGARWVMALLLLLLLLLPVLVVTVLATGG